MLKVGGETKGVSASIGPASVKIGVPLFGPMGCLTSMVKGERDFWENEEGQI